MDDPRPTFQRVFKISVKVLNLIRAYPFIERNLAWAMSVVCVMSVFVICFLLLCNSIIYHDLPTGNTANASSCGVIAIICAILALKYTLLIWFKNETIWAIRYIDEDYKLFRNLTREERETVKTYALKGVWISKLWLYASSSAGFVFPVKALILMGYRLAKHEFTPEPAFPYAYPSFIEAHIDNPVVFCTMFVLIGVMLPVCGIFVYTGFDPLAPTFMLHACGQLELVNGRILQMFSEEHFDPDNAKKFFKEIVLHLQSIYGFVDCIKKTTSLLYEFTMKFTTIMITFSAYEVVETMKQGTINLEFIIMELACLIHFYIPCYYSNLLIEKGDSLFKTVYASRWETQPAAAAKMRSELLLVMMRASRPLGIRSIFWTINLGAFAEMCRQSYAIFNLMNAALK